MTPSDFDPCPVAFSDGGRMTCFDVRDECRPSGLHPGHSWVTGLGVGSSNDWVER
jgi:hypothetical protein